MEFRKKFLNDLKCNVIVKGNKTFKQLAELYGYPDENGDNLCKKDYYRFKEKCIENNKDTQAVTKTLNPESKYNNLVLKSQWEVQTKGGGKDILRSYRNDITPIQIKEFRDSLISEIKSFSPVNKFTFKKPDIDTNNILLISIPDYHVGRQILSTEVANNYMNTIANIIHKTDMSTIEKIIYVIGNDFFNSDNSYYTTTKGTQQFDYGTWKESWNFGKNLLLDSIEYLKNYDLPIDVINVPGNHDSNKMFYLGDLIDAYYKNDDQVTVNNSDKLFKSFVYGSSLLVFEHGELRDVDYPLVIASEFPKEWGNSNFRYMFCGHLHHTIIKEFRGNCFVKFLPSLAKSSSWELSKGYKTSPKAEGCIINKNNGLIYNININY